MIKINLTPYEELDDPRWWVPDAVVLFIVILLSYGAVYLYIDSVEQDIAARETEKTNMVSETQGLNGDVGKFNDLNTKISTLANKKESLKRITESKLVRYLPVILMENIQNLKPDKVWLTGMAFVDKKPEANAPPPPPPPPPALVPEGTPKADPNAAQTAPAPVAAPVVQNKKAFDFPVTIELTGNALDNVAIADFMLSLKGTQNQTFEKSDLRTQLFFNDVGIAFSQITTEKTSIGSGDKNKKAGPQYVSFKLILTFKERTEGSEDKKFSQFIDQFNRTGQASVN